MLTPISPRKKKKNKGKKASLLKQNAMKHFFSFKVPQFFYSKKKIMRFLSCLNPRTAHLKGAAQHRQLIKNESTNVPIILKKIQ